MCAAGLACEHRDPCPAADSEDCQAAKIRDHFPAAGYTALCNGLILFEDGGYLLPDGRTGGPSRPVETGRPQALKGGAP
ncbi:DUF5999 family protein [Streptomyces sp. NPDC048290]|uniref:DUF5999 family protein n=1 Tax=Streptomyces sp. NPDC048290 TaxID=3155811 RepID=UPI00342B3B38